MLSVLFAGLTFTLLQPLLDLLFYDKGVLASSPEFHFSVIWLKKVVMYHAQELSHTHSKSTALLFVAIVIVVANLISNAFKFISNIFMAKLRTSVVRDFRRDIFYKLTNLHVGFIENNRKGDLITRVTGDVNEVESSVVITFEAVFRDPITIIFFLMLMFSQSWQLTLFMFALMPFTAFFISSITKKLKRDAHNSQGYFSRIMSLVDETLQGIRIIKAFNAENYTREAFNKMNNSYTKLNRKQYYRRNLAPAISETSGVITVGIILWYGGNLVFEGSMQAAGFIAYIALVSQIIRPAKSFSQSFSNISKGIASAERVFTLMDTPIEVGDGVDSVNVENFTNRIEFRDVNFSYGTEQVLKNINLYFEKGKTYALVGPSGSGKSTLAELLLRFYDVTEGSISLDGKDIKNIKTESLRRLMAVVTQDPILFNDTISSNIAFGLNGVSFREIEDAAKAANAHEFIIENPEGYNYVTGDRGGLLSGGQRQRISIARAILKNPQILVLDEATSALDTSSEKNVQEALQTLMKNRTSIVIAHRLSTIQDADMIIVLDKGNIVEKGTHLELINRKGLYFSLYQLQQLES